ncbi:MAG: hypothetical protein JNL10_11235 [Verrucomicrobiales bacterium]|nr:hypothetical protein [Verrucomicrobiales bacterium]
MNPPPDSEDWLDEVQGRRLPPEATGRLRRELASRPRERQRLEEELALNRALDSLPCPDVSSNFLAQVEAQIVRSEAGRKRGRSGLWHWLGAVRWARPIAAVMVAVVAIGGWWQFRVHERSALAGNLAAVSRVAGMPGVDSLQDFEAVQLLRTAALPGDVELLAALDSDPTATTP